VHISPRLNLLGEV